MTDLREAWDLVGERLARSRHVLVLLDYDGTLVPIVERPHLALLPSETRRLLAELRDLPGVIVGFVSGRALDDLASRVFLDGVWYVGNHGFEARSPRGDVTRFFEPEETAVLKQLRAELEDAVFAIPGVLLEPKGPTLALHYRLVAPERVEEVERAFLEVVGRHHAKLQLGYGKAVVEARLRSPCSKGTAVRYIRRLSPSGALPIYFGDDRTDQYAFRELWGSGISVGVGQPGPLMADFTLPSPAEVVEILDRLRSVREERFRELAH